LRELFGLFDAKDLGSASASASASAAASGKETIFLSAVAV